MSTKIIDYTGRRVRVGMTVVYPARRGSKMWLESIRITAIEERSTGPILVGYKPDRPDKRRTTVRNLTNLVIIEDLDATI